jgi:hypothetical protein
MVIEGIVGCHLIEMSYLQPGLMYWYRYDIGVMCELQCITDMATGRKIWGGEDLKTCDEAKGPVEEPDVSGTMVCLRQH